MNNPFEDTTHGTMSIPGNMFLRWLPKRCEHKVYKEYNIQRILSPTGCVPSVRTVFRCMNRAFILEEKVFMAPYSKSEAYIQKVGHTLKVLHAHAREYRPEINRFVPEDSLLLEGTFCPENVLENLVEKPFASLLANSTCGTAEVQQLIRQLGETIRNLSKEIVMPRDQCTLVHGSLDHTNVVLSRNTNEIVFLDWADCRYDVASADVAQFIYLHRLNETETHIFLEAYDCHWITNSILRVHVLLSLGWDIVYLLMRNLSIPSRLNVDHLKRLKRILWSQVNPAC